MKKAKKISNKNSKMMSPTEYEMLSRDVLADYYSKKNRSAVVTHDVDLPSKANDDDGRAVMRQVDVLAEFEDGKEKDIVVQCKNWTSSITLPVVDSLVGMLSGLQRSCKGIFVTPKGYQSGALRLALQQGLELCILRRTTASDFKNNEIPTIDGWVIMRGIRSDDVQIEIPIEFSKKYSEEFKLIGKRSPDELPIFDVSGTKIGTMNDLHREVHNHLGLTNEYDEALLCTPEPRTYLKINDDLVEIVKLRGRFTGKNLERKVLRNSLAHVFGNMNTGEILFVDEKNRLSKPGEDLCAETECFDLKQYYPHWFPD